MQFLFKIALKKVQIEKQTGTLSLFEYLKTPQMPLLQPVTKGGANDSKPVLHAAAEVDGGRLWEVLRRAGDFGHLEAGIENLRQHLVVKDKVVRVGVVVDGLQNLP